MLVSISDLHFVDGTAGEHNLPSRASEYFFDERIVREKDIKMGDGLGQTVHARPQLPGGYHGKKLHAGIPD
jgi:hypothetical protein